MRRLLYSILTMCAMLLVSAGLFADSPTTLPKFEITADVMRLDLKKTPRSLVYERNVVYTSPLYQTRITCNRMETNAASTKAISAVTATGNVVFSLTGEDEQGKPTYRVNGTTSLLTYTIQNGDPVIRLVKQNDIQPSLIITDLASKEQTDLTGSGDVMEYNLKTQTLEVKKVKMASEGSGK